MEEVQKVCYYESIVDSNIGNNPHNGEGEYDAGEEFFDRLRKPFEQAIKNGEYDAVDQETLEEISSVTFNISDAEEATAKTKYYTGETEESLSILNDKSLEIKFNTPNGVNSNDFKNFIINKVLLYVEQMIPSTTITYYKFDEESIFA